MPLPMGDLASKKHSMKAEKCSKVNWAAWEYTKCAFTCARTHTHTQHTQTLDIEQLAISVHYVLRVVPIYIWY